MLSLSHFAHRFLLLPFLTMILCSSSFAAEPETTQKSAVESLELSTLLQGLILTLPKFDGRQTKELPATQVEQQILLDQYSSHLKSLNALFYENVSSLAPTPEMRERIQAIASDIGKYWLEFHLQTFGKSAEERPTIQELLAKAGLTLQIAVGKLQALANEMRIDPEFSQTEALRTSAADLGPSVRLEFLSTTETFAILSGLHRTLKILGTSDHYFTTHLRDKRESYYALLFSDIQRVETILETSRARAESIRVGWQKELVLNAIEEIESELETYIEEDKNIADYHDLDKNEWDDHVTAFLSYLEGAAVQLEPALSKSQKSLFALDLRYVERLKSLIDQPELLKADLKIYLADLIEQGQSLQTEIAALEKSHLSWTNELAVRQAEHAQVQSELTEERRNLKSATSELNQTEGKRVRAERAIEAARSAVPGFENLFRDVQGTVANGEDRSFTLYHPNVLTGSESLAKGFLEELRSLLNHELTKALLEARARNFDNWRKLRQERQLEKDVNFRIQNLVAAVEVQRPRNANWIQAVHLDLVLNVGASAFGTSNAVEMPISITAPRTRLKMGLDLDWSTLRHVLSEALDKVGTQALQEADPEIEGQRLTQLVRTTCEQLLENLATETR